MYYVGSFIINRKFYYKICAKMHRKNMDKNVLYQHGIMECHKVEYLITFFLDNNLDYQLGRFCFNNEKIKGKINWVISISYSK